MFKKKRLMVNNASEYERITDNEEEKEHCSSSSSGDVSEDSPIIPACYRGPAEGWHRS